MTFAKGVKRFGWWEKFKEEKLEDVKKILGHVGLYVGLIIYTAFGGLVSKKNFISIFREKYQSFIKINDRFNLWEG